jgi:hypothetical protein
MTEGFFAAAPYHQPQDQLERLLGYVDFRGSITCGELSGHTCLLGTLVQETYATHPDIRAACDKGMSTHIAIGERYRGGQTTLRTGRDLERGELGLLHSVRPAGGIYLCEGKANRRCRSRELGVFAALSGSSIHSTPEPLKEGIHHEYQNLRQPAGEKT